MSWTGLSPYIFPPFNLIGKVVNKIISDNVEQAIVIIPFWKSQSWYPLVLSNIVSFPLRLPRHRDLLVLPHNGQLHPLNHSMTMVAVQLSANPYRIEAFQQELSKSSCQHGDLEPANNMVWLGTSGIFGVIQDKVIPFRRLKV
jgi:hypothetical protein